MSDKTTTLMADVENCTSDEKDLILYSLLRQKWDREARRSTIPIQSPNSMPLGFFLPIVDPAPESTVPQISAQALQQIQNAASNTVDAFTSDEAKEYLRQEIARKRAKA